jgi:D-tyrosyl-tRNA(Tyr) deacylase
LLVLLGVTHDDGPAEVAWMARKVWTLRILRDEQSASDVDAPILVVSQFTLYGDARKGRRPTWNAAAPGEVSEPVYEQVCSELEGLGATVARGRFGADMQVALVNDGPVTLVLDTAS